MALARVPPAALMRSGDIDDPRAQRTRNALLAEFEKQLAGATPPTVTSIIREARVSRSAFYAHFSSLESLRTAAVKRVLDNFGNDMLSGDRGRSNDSDAVAFALPYEVLFGYIASHRPLFLNAQPATADPLGQLRSALVEQFTRAVEHAPRRPRNVESSQVATYVVGGLLACVEEWLADSDACTARAFADQVAALLPAWLISEPNARPGVEVVADPS